MSLPHLRRIPLHSPTVSSRRGRSTGLRCPWSDRKSTRLNSSHLVISYAVFCLKKKKKHDDATSHRLHHSLHQRQLLFRHCMRLILLLHCSVHDRTCPLSALVDSPERTVTVVER